MITLAFEKSVDRALSHSTLIKALSEKLLTAADVLRAAKDTPERRKQFMKLEMLTEAMSNSIAAWNYFGDGAAEEEWLTAIRAEIEELCNAVAKT